MWERRDVSPTTIKPQVYIMDDMPFLSKEALEQKLMAKREVDEATQCWVWTGSWNDKGYGRVIVKATPGQACRSAHVVAAHVWRDVPLANKTIVVAHTCECRACFNPKHLKIFKNRSAYIKWLWQQGYNSKLVGETHPSAKMTLEKAVEIRDALVYGGESNTKIAARLNVTRRQVEAVKLKLAWKCVWDYGFNKKFNKILEEKACKPIS